MPEHEPAVLAPEPLAQPATAPLVESPRGLTALTDAVVLSLQRTAGNQATIRMLQRDEEKKKPEPPGYLVQHTFCGKGVGVGINPVMKERLEKAEAHIRDIVWPALPKEEKIDRTSDTGAETDDYRKWLGITSVGSWKPGSFHQSGSAVDISPNQGPYIATRTEEGGKTTYGGEAAGAGLQAERKRSVEVMDRAVQWTIGTGQKADVSARKSGETTGQVYDRMKSASDSLSVWMMQAIPHNKPAMVNRAPIPDVHDASKVSDADLLDKIKEGERLPMATGVQLIKEEIERDSFKQTHPGGWPMTPEATYYQVLRDYEMVRIPMVSGQPSASPATTRNPVHGFIHHRKQLVEALVDVGKLRWGACDLGAGSSGDTHHFDLGFHPPDYQPVK